MDRDSLPNDAERLKDLVVELAEKNALLVQSNEAQARAIADLERQLFGRKSERVCTSTQLDDEATATSGLDDGEAPTSTATRPTPPKMEKKARKVSTRRRTGLSPGR